MRVLGTPSLEVRRKTLDLVLELSYNGNIETVVAFLMKELGKTNKYAQNLEFEIYLHYLKPPFISSTDEFEKNGDYRQLLVRSLHACGVRFPATAGNIAPQLMEYLSDANSLLLLLDLDCHEQ
jgi:coatomer subunit beta